MAITKHLIEQIAEAEYGVQEFFSDEPRRPVLNEPATEQELARLDVYLGKDGLNCPPSYRQFLRICNGIQGFRPDFSLLPIERVIKGPSADFKRDYPNLARFMIGRGDDTRQYMALNPEKAKGEELEFVYVYDDGNEWRYPNFGKYLETLLGELSATLEKERADRKRKKKK